MRLAVVSIGFSLASAIVGSDVGAQQQKKGVLRNEHLRQRRCENSPRSVTPSPSA
jgi:hypothetical protein